MYTDPFTDHFILNVRELGIKLYNESKFVCNYNKSFIIRHIGCDEGCTCSHSSEAKTYYITTWGKSIYMQYILSFPIYFILSERKIPKWFKNTQAPEVKNISFYYEIMYSTLNYFIINRNILTSCTCGQLNTLKHHFKKRKEHFLWSIERYQIFVHEQVRVTSLSSGKRGCIFWLF